MSTLLCALPLLTHAQTLHITPARIDSSHSVEEALITHKSHAKTTIDGQGGTLELRYQSNEPIEIYMVPLGKNSSYVPTDYIRFTLPMASDGTVSIDLTVSTGWSPEHRQWMLTLLGTDETTNAAFTDIRFGNERTSNASIVALRHFFVPEMYTPSSVHALRGYRVLGRSFTTGFGVLTICIVLLILAVSRKKYRKPVLLTLVIASLLYQARFNLDLLRLTSMHLGEYSRGTYDSAESIHLIADTLKTLVSDPAKTTVYVCRDGTNFKEKLLRYFTYPIRISSDAADAEKADYAVVMNKFKWGFDTELTKDGSSVTLNCGDLHRKAQKLNTFPKNEILFQLLAPRSSASAERSGAPS